MSDAIDTFTSSFCSLENGCPPPFQEPVKTVERGDMVTTSWSEYYEAIFQSDLSHMPTERCSSLAPTAVRRSSLYIVTCVGVCSCCWVVRITVIQIQTDRASLTDMRRSNASVSAFSNLAINLVLVLFFCSKTFFTF